MISNRHAGAANGSSDGPHRRNSRVGSKSGLGRLRWQTIFSGATESPRAQVRIDTEKERPNVAKIGTVVFDPVAAKTVVRRLVQALFGLSLDCTKLAKKIQKSKVTSRDESTWVSLMAAKN